MLRVRMLSAVLILLLGVPASAVNWPSITLTQYVSGLSGPVDIQNAADGSGRLFVIEQAGRIRIVTNGVLVSTPFLDIGSRVSHGGEQGLLGLAFPPGFSTGRHFYVSYTDPGWTSVISRFGLTANDNLANTNSEEQILRVHQPFENHNGGQIGFGPDGYLYIGFGDGGSGNDPSNLSQNASVLLGKMVRIGVEPPNGTNYTIPASNPFVSSNGYRGEIWALGLRNPWRWAFDGLTGGLYIADVGQNSREEVNVQPAASAGGENYGWRRYEATLCTGLDSCDSSGLTMPVAEYPHSLGCSITGGKVYRGLYYSYMYGAYLFSDWCSGRFWALKKEGGNWYTNQLLQVPINPTTFGVDELGNLYVADGTSGRVYRVQEVFADADSDGMRDAWETYYGLSTNANDSAGDADGDHAPNADEFLAGTDPGDSNSVFTAGTLGEGPAGEFVIRWSSVTGKLYDVTRSTNLLTGFSVAASNIPSTPPANTYTDAASLETVFYQVRVTP